MLYLLFFVSGAAALMYESVWTRYLGLLVGHDAYAQVVVLTIFLGGMSAGAWFVSRHTARIARPLRAYALVEGAVGIIGLLFHDVFAGAASLAYDQLFPALSGSALLEPAKWTLAGLLILPQSILLGTTFPLMSAGVMRARQELPGRVLAWLYFTNALGGALGVLVAGFVLVAIAGLPGVLTAAAILNLLVALGALLISRRTEAAPAAPVPPADRPSEQLPGRLEPILLGMAFGTAVASFAYEIDWIRMLSLVLGSATHSFELMLSAFILGLALGALFIRRRLDALQNPLVTLGIVQVVMGLFAVLTLPVYVASFSWTATFLHTFMRTDSGYAGFTFVRYLICLVVMLPATFCAGMTLPLITRALVTSGSGERAIGRVYAWNTFGSIVGVVIAGLVLLPLLGLKRMMLAAGALDAALGIMLLLLLHARRAALTWGAVTLVVLASVALLVPLDRALLVSGVFRSGRVGTMSDSTVQYYADGRTATVAVGGYADGSRMISTNGKSDASLSGAWRTACTPATVRRRLGGDEITQALLPLVTLSYRPDAARAAVIGFGSGMSSHFLLASSTLTNLTTIEIEPRMVDGARHFLPANRRVYDDPRSRTVLRDAKAHFATAGTTWDLILSEPSNPWVSGVSGLFTEEFYRRVDAALGEGGVFGQWLHTYELSDELVLTVLAAIDRTFPSWRLHQVGPGDLLIVASRAPLAPPAFSQVIGMPGLAGDLCRVAPIDGRDLESVVLAESALFRPLLERIGQPNSDFYPALDLGAERARFGTAMAAGVVSLGGEWFNLGRALVDQRGVTPSSRRMPFEGINRATDAWIRAGLDAPDTVDVHRERALWTWRHWNLLVGDNTAPPSWGPWLESMGNAARLRHGGMAGVVDTAFFAAADAAARRWQAPAAVHAAIMFRRGVQAWDAPQALAAAAQLRAAGVIGRLVSVDEVRDGAVAMALRAGDVPAAERWLNDLGPRSQRGDADLRSMLLDAWVGAAGMSPGARVRAP